MHEVQEPPRMGRGVFILVLISAMWLGLVVLQWPSNSLLPAMVLPQKELPLMVHSNNSSSVGKTLHHKDPKMNAWLSEQNQRRRFVHNACQRLSKGSTPFSMVNLSRQRKKMLQHMVVDDVHQVLYCYIPKIACSNWKRIMMILSGKTTATDPRDFRRIGNPHNPGVLFKLENYSLKNAAYRLKTYKKFFFVRHPFERLVSAYRNKFESYANSSMNFKVDYGSKIVKGFKMGDQIPFTNFVDYIIKKTSLPQKLPLNEHWATYDDLCHPCLIPYDFIGYYNSLEEDAENILRYIGAPPDLHFPDQKSANTSSLVDKYLKLLTPKQLDALYRIYSKDFTLFGYSRNLTFV